MLYIIFEFIGQTITVKHLISAVSNCRGLIKMTYSRILILALKVYYGFRYKENLISSNSSYFLNFLVNHKSYHLPQCMVSWNGINNISNIHQVLIFI